MSQKIEVVCKECFETDIDATACRLRFEGHTAAIIRSDVEANHTCDICGSDAKDNIVCHMYQHTGGFYK